MILGLLTGACKQKNPVDGQNASGSYELKKSDRKISFELDSDTRYNGFYLYPFTGKDGKEYLSFLNYRTNQLLFYDFETCDFLFKTEMDREGPDGISLISGYYIKDFDNMYVSSYSDQGLLRIDTSRHIVQKIPYGVTAGGYTVVPSYTPSSYPYIAPVFIGNKMYMTQMAADHIYPAAKTPVSVAIDTSTHVCEELPFYFGDVLGSEQFTRSGEARFSRIFDGRHFVYSFYASHPVYVASVDHKEVRKIELKSQYIGEIKAETMPEDANQAVKRHLEVPRYGDLIYDSYREVYYRFVYPETTLEENKKWMGASMFGRKKFSVMILDKDFRLIGETLFPEGIYNSYVFFVHKDGLYISSDYQINYDQPEGTLNFERFDLVEQK